MDHAIKAYRYRWDLIETCKMIDKNDDDNDNGDDGDSCLIQ